MNIIIKLTTDEIHELAREALKSRGFPSDSPIQIVVANDCSSLATVLREILQDFPDYRGGQKISAIKALRDRGPRKADLQYGTLPEISLFDAKWAIENPEDAIANLNRCGKIKP